MIRSIRILTLLGLLLPAISAFFQGAQGETQIDRTHKGTPADEEAARRDAEEILAAADPVIAREDAVSILTTIASKRYEDAPRASGANSRSPLSSPNGSSGSGSPRPGMRKRFFQEFRFPTASG